MWFKLSQDVEYTVCKWDQKLFKCTLKLTAKYFRSIGRINF